MTSESGQTEHGPLHGHNHPHPQGPAPATD